MKKIYMIVGPTASGKSEFAIRLAQYLNGSIINADSIQVYQDIPLLTARPDEAEQQNIPHLLYGYLDKNSHCSVNDWIKQVIPILKTVSTPILVGGTGLYIKALTDGLNDIPEVDPSIRQSVRHMPLEEVKAKVIDCIATDPQRLRRALEVQLTTGKPLSYFQQQPLKRPIEADFDITLINRPRQEIRTLCHTRFLKMLDKGAIEQVKTLQALNPTGGITKAIGYKEICAYLDHQISYDKMIDLAVTATRQYAKRQQTWFKHQLPPAKIIENPLNFKI